MSQTQGSRRRRGRGKPNRSRAAEFQARVDSDVEDRGTFWARSNARLGFEVISNGGKGRPRQVVELNCTVCGVGVLVERAPKNRYEVRCSECRAALGGLLQGDERDIANEMHRANSTGRGKGRRDGLPELTEEDRAAIAEMRARKELGNGQVGNNRRRRSGGGGGGGGRRRRGGGGGGGGGGNRSGGNRNGGNRNGGNRSNRGGNGGNGNGGNEQGNGEGRRRRRRRRRGGGGGGESNGNGNGGDGGNGGNGGGSSD